MAAGAPRAISRRIFPTAIDAALNRTGVAMDQTDAPSTAGEGEALSRRRLLSGPMNGFVGVVAVSWSVFQLFTAYHGALPPLQQRTIHLAGAFLLVFTVFPPIARFHKRGSAIMVLDVVCGLLAAGACGYVALNHYDIVARSGSYTAVDLAFSGIALVALLEATRRTLGWALPVTALVALAYAYFGYAAPDLIAHQGFSLRRIVGFLFLTTEGVFGLILGVSADFIFVFILIAVFVQRLGGGQLFVDLSLSAFGWARGGAAKIAVVASGLFGMISGSTVANAGTCGPITIPMMKRTGFRATFAAAVESVASCGGQIMPPIMGTGAFLMAELLDVPYSRVALAAALPALLFYVALFIMVDLEAASLGLRGLPRETLPRLGRVVRTQGYLALPLVALVVLLGLLDYSARLAGFWSVVVASAVLLYQSGSRAWVRRLWDALKNGALAATEVAIVCGCVGIVVGMIMMTGIGLKLSQVLITVSGGNLAILLVLTMIASLVLGTALPTTPTYLILAILVAPALIEMGVKPLPAHLFIFYYGVLADITPPTALCAYVAASIAGAPFLRTTFLAVGLSFAGYLLPFTFVYHPELLMIGSIGSIVWRAGTAVVGLLALGVAIRGVMSRKVGWIWRAILVGAALGLASGHFAVEVAAAAAVAFGLWWHRSASAPTHSAGAAPTAAGV
jgi:TRAP transporter 4TM/12TM fusion protein